MPFVSSKTKKYAYKCTVRLLDDSEILQCEFLVGMMDNSAMYSVLLLVMDNNDISI